MEAAARTGRGRLPAPDEPVAPVSAPSPPAEPAPPAPAPAQLRAQRGRDRHAQGHCRGGEPVQPEIPHYYLETEIDLGKPLQWLEEENRKRSVRERILPVALWSRRRP